MDQVRHHETMIAFTLFVALVLAGPLSLLLNASGDLDDRTRPTGWLGTRR